MMGILDKDNKPYQGEDLQRYIERALQVLPPDGIQQKLFYQTIKYYFAPQLIGTKNIPDDQPSLYVANHSLFAMDGMVLMPTLLEEKGIFLRAMSDKFMWTPATEGMLLSGGGILGDPQVCSAMMESGADLLVFPGGAHESVKRSDKRYELQWKERYGFVRMAAQHGYNIVPTAIVGPDEFFNHRIEGEELPNTTVGNLLKQAGLLTDKTRTDLLMPIPSGLWGTLLPKPQRSFFKFGKPVDLASYRGREITLAEQKKIRTKVAHQIEKMLAELLLLREQQGDSESIWRRLLSV